MVSKAEEIASRCLREILGGLQIGEAIPESPEFQQVLSGLSWFLPTVLAEIHPEWKGESLDGFGGSFAQKISDREAEILGFCWLLSDQTLAPIHVRLRISGSADEISWLELKLGEKRHGGMMRITGSSSPSIYKRLHRLSQEADTMEWAYKVTYGEQDV